jgi:hypothetical protein
MEESGIIAAGVLVAFAAPAAAQAPIFLRGTIDSIDGDTMIMTTRAGETVTVMLGDPLTIGYNVEFNVEDLEAGVQLGVTTVTGPDGNPVPFEVHVMDDAGNINMPWQHDLAPDAMMTNGVIAEAETVGDGRQITVHYDVEGGGGDVTVVVPDDIPVLRNYNDGDRSLLVPGAFVFVVGVPLEDGGYTTNYIQAEKDGVRPAL